MTVVMPAEYAIDPTGFGKLTGLQQMGEIRVSLAEEAAQEEAAKLASAAQPAAEVVKPAPVAAEKPAVISARKDTTTFTLAPNEAAEIKATMNKGHKVNFEWNSTGKINYDYHADSKELKIKYHGYGKGVGQQSDKGVIEAAFDGKHGWFWRNRTKETVTVTLATNGEYSEIKRVD